MRTKEFHSVIFGILKAIDRVGGMAVRSSSSASPRGGTETILWTPFYTSDYR